MKVAARLVVTAGAAAARAALALLLAAGALRADEARGVELTRQAQAALAAGDAAGALALLERARPEWPGSAIVANTLGDVHRVLGQYPEAAREYERGMRDGCEHHAHFNRGVTLNEQAESALGEAGVPLDPAGLPEGPQPEMLAAIRSALPVLELARKDFLEALDLRDDLPGRESLGALNRRVDELRRMQADLEQREQEDQQKDPDQQQDPKDQQPPQDQPPPESDKEEQQDGKEQQEPKDEQDPSQEAQPEESSDKPSGDEPQPSEGVPQGAPARELSKEEVQQLLDKLEQLEKQGRLLQKAQQAAQHEDVEKDW